MRAEILIVNGQVTVDQPNGSFTTKGSHPHSLGAQALTICFVDVGQVHQVDLVIDRR